MSAPNAKSNPPQAEVMDFPELVSQLSGRTVPASPQVQMIIDWVDGLGRIVEGWQRALLERHFADDTTPAHSGPPERTRGWYPDKPAGWRP